MIEQFYEKGQMIDQFYERGQIIGQFLPVICLLLGLVVPLNCKKIKTFFNFNT